MVSHLPQRFVFRIKGFQCPSPLAIPPLVQPTGHRHLQAVNLNFQSVITGDIALPP